MSQILLTKIFYFESAHVLYNHDSKCKNIHGHSYQLHVTISGKVKNEPGHPHDGMIIDFSILKKIIQKEVIDHIDHALLISEKHPLIIDKNELQKFHEHKILILPFQPTTENIIQYIANKIMNILPPHIKLHKLKLNETPTSYAEWIND